MTDPASRARSSEWRAMEAYVEEAPSHGHAAQIIDVTDFDRLSGFDAAFLRLDTGVLGLSFAASRYAWELGLRIVDDPKSILTCMNKAHVHGLLEHAGIATPDTVLLTRAGYDRLDADDLFAELGAPIVCKAPSGAFSSAVEKAHDDRALKATVRRFASRSDVVLLQRYTPSAFDWRIGVLCGRPLYAARYHIPKGAWRIHDKPEGASRRQWARVEPVALDAVPQTVLATGVAAAAVVGFGLYGVDVKETPGGDAVVIEVNDNPNLDWGQEVEAGSGLFGEVVRRIAEEGPRA